MKTRQGFVSNSSTSSFVAIGIFLDAKTNTMLSVLTTLYPDEVPPPANPEDPEDTDDQDEWIWETAMREILVKEGGKDNTLPKDTIFVGHTIDTGDDEGTQMEGRWTLTELEDKVNAIRDRLGLPRDSYPTELVTGTDCC